MKKCNFINNILNAINPYHWVTWARNRAFDHGILKSRSFEIPTICIGNITIGGTGKTPHTEYLINLLNNEYSVAVLSRGYGRKSKGFIKADEHATMQQIGDEPFQIKSKYPDIIVAVDEKRVHGIEQLLKGSPKPEVILLDDAYQHRYAKAGIYILLIDFNRPIWNDRVLPFGRLRESEAGKERADIIIITKCSTEMTAQQQEYCRRAVRNKKGAPVFFSTMKYGQPYPLFSTQQGKAPSLDGCSVLLLTGIAAPQPLKNELERQGAKVRLMQYADHHNFSVQELQNVAHEFEKEKTNNKIIITTEKDAARLTAQTELPSVIKENIYALPIEVDFLNEEKNIFNQTISDYVRKN